MAGSERRRRMETALGGILAAGSLALLWLACVVPSGRIGLAAAAGLFPMTAAMCVGRGLLQARCEKLTDIPEKVDFFDNLPDYGVDLFTNKKSKCTPEVAKRMLDAAVPALESLPDWTQEAIHSCLTALAEQLEVKTATLMWPVRISAAGKAVTPGGAVEICHILGREETLRRLKVGAEKC